MSGGELQLIALFGQRCHLLVRAEVIRRLFQRLQPACDAFRQRPVDVLERLLGGGVARLPDSIEDAPRHSLLLGFVTEKRIF